MTDGTSNIILLSEAIIGDGTPYGTDPGHPQEQSWLRAALLPNAGTSGETGSGPSAFTLSRGACASGSSEIIPNPDIDSVTSGTSEFIGWRGYMWLSARAPATLFSTYSTPNPLHPDLGWRSVYGYYAARSFHTGGVNVTLGDGSVRFVSNTVALDIWRNYGKVGSGFAKPGL
jgi:prepilin-type processing-associated H-X9-DG protein